MFSLMNKMLMMQFGVMQIMMMIIFRQTRTLTEESRLGEVLEKGDIARQKRNRRKSTDDLLDVQLPSNEVFNFNLVLKPRKPLVPEWVVTDRCQCLDGALDVLVPRHGADDQGGVLPL